MSAPPPPPQGPGPPPQSADAVASADVLRRVQALAAGWAILAGAGLAAWGGWRRGVVLTLAAALSIVALRSLEGVVRRLRVSADGGAPDSLGVGYVLRLLLLAVLVTILALGGRDPLALLLGLSAVPLALIAEAFWQLAALRGRDSTAEGREGEP